MKTWIIFFTGFLTVSCSKETGDGTKDKLAPEIVFISPVNNQVLPPGQFITIEGTVTDNIIIAEIHIHVTNNETGTKYLDIHLYPGSSSTVFFNQSLTAVTDTDYKIQVLATDRSGNQGIKTIYISTN